MERAQIEQRTAKVTEPGHVFLCENLRVFETRAECSDVGGRQRGFEGVQDDAVCAVSYSVDVLQQNSTRLRQSTDSHWRVGRTTCQPSFMNFGMTSSQEVQSRRSLHVWHAIHAWGWTEI